MPEFSPAEPANASATPASIVTFKPATVARQLLSMLGYPEEVTLFHRDDEGKRAGTVTKPVAEVAGAIREALEAAGDRHVFAAVQGIRLAFLNKDKANGATARLDPSYAMDGPHDSVHPIYLADTDDGLSEVLLDLQEAETDDAYAENDVPLPYGEYSVRDDDMAGLKEGFESFALAELEAVFFGPEADGSGLSAEDDPSEVAVSIEDCLETGQPFFDAVVTGELFPGVLDQPFVGSVLSNQQTTKADNRFSNIRGVYRHIAEHHVSDKKEGPGFTACHLARDEETKKPRRKKRNVESNGAFMFDFDGGQTTEEILGKFEALGCTFGAYSSYNHLKTPGVHKLRVVLPFAKPFIPDDYGDRENYAAAVWRTSLDAFAEKHGLELDRNARDITRFMNSPRHPKGGTFFSRIHLGPLYNVEVVLPEDRPIAKIAKKRGVTLAYDVSGEAYVAEGNGVEFFLSLIGDGEDQLGFHDPIYRVCCSYLSPANEGPNADAGPIVRRLRQVIENTQKGPGRDQADIVRYTSNAYLSAEIENARAFIRKIEAEKAEAEQAEAEHFDALVADYRENPNPRKLETICDELAKIDRSALTNHVREGLAEGGKGRKVSRSAFDKVFKCSKDNVELKRFAAKVRARRAGSPKPVIFLDADGFAAQCAGVVDGLNARNAADPFFFITDRVQKRLAFDNGVPVMDPLDWNKFKHEMNASVIVYEDADSALDISLPDDTTSHLYGSPESYGLPLQRLLRHPVHASDGTLSVKDGYDPGTEDYFDLRGLDIGHIPQRPSKELVRWSVKVFTDHLLVDFPLSDGFSTELVDKDGNPVEDTGKGSRANAIAMLLDPFVQGLVDGPTPLYAIDKPKAGTGATKLAKLAHIMSLGREVEPTVLPTNDEAEARKMLMGVLLAAIPDVFMDNVEAEFEYQAMLAYATGTGLSGRLLGGNRYVELRRRNRTILTGNRLAPGEQMTRRIVPIYLNAHTSRPELRAGFKYPDLEKTALKYRRILIRAALIIVQNWFALGCPESDIAFGSYEDYAKIMGGVLSAAGIDGFMSNRETYYEAKRGDVADVTEFILALYDGMTETEKEAGFDGGYAWSIAYANGVLQYECLKLGDIYGDKAQKSALGNYITKNLLNTYTLTVGGNEIEVELVKGKRKTSGVRWRFESAPVRRACPEKM